MEQKSIYYMENRGWGFLFHFFIFTVGGLRHCKGEKPIIYIPYMKPKIREFDETILRNLGYGDEEINTTKEFPSNYNWKNADINYEICDLLKDKYHFVFTLEDFPNLENYRIEKCHGQEDTTWQESFLFLKNLFEDILGNEPLDTNKFIYITRKGSENISVHGGKKVRCILNEDDVVQALTPLGFQYVQLENLPFKEKIKLFQSAKVIVAPNSAALMFAIFCKKETCIVEMIPNYVVGHFKTHWDQRQYEIMCKTLDIPYLRFQHYSYVEDYLNGIIRVDTLYEVLNTLLK